MAKLVGDAFLKQSAPPVKNGTRYVCPVVNGRTCGMMQWGYDAAAQLPRHTTVTLLMALASGTAAR